MLYLNTFRSADSIEYRNHLLACVNVLFTGIVLVFSTDTDFYRRTLTPLDKGRVNCTTTRQLATLAECLMMKFTHCREPFRGTLPARWLFSVNVVKRICYVI